MTELDQIVAGTVALAPDGELVGRIRLQKIVYLMEQLGLKSGAGFSYHHYGPYSEALYAAVEDAKFWGRLEEQTMSRASDGAPYSAFRAKDAPPTDKLGQLPVKRARELLAKLTPVHSTVLELAATIHWLAFKEKVADWRAEIEKRKAGKTSSGRLEKAEALLKELGLAPA